MNCADVQRFADAYVDGEFDGSEQRELDAHLDSCERCATAIAQRTAFRHFLKNAVGPVEAPQHLRIDIQKALKTARGEQLALSPRPLFGAAAALCAILLVPGLLQKHQNFTEETVYSAPLPVVEALVDWHRRSLPVEVTGPDAETVVQWFSDKVDFPVHLPQFEADEDANVLGGRLTQMNNRSAAHVVYDVEGTKVSVLMYEDAVNLTIPQKRDDRIGDDYYRSTSAGYNVALFNNNGVTYVIATDLPANTFDNLVSTASLR